MSKGGDSNFRVTFISHTEISEITEITAPLPLPLKGGELSHVVLAIDSTYQ